MDFSNTPDYHGSREIGLNTWLIAFSTIFYGLRLYVRTAMTKSPGLDDWLAGMAYLALLFQSMTDIHSVSLGSGTHQYYIPQDLLDEFFKTLTVQTLVYFWAVALVRFAILAFLPRLAQDRSITIISWTVAVIIIAQTLGAFTYKLTECHLIEDILRYENPGNPPHGQCVGVDDQNKMMVGHGIIGIVVDAILLFLPIWVICTKMMWSRKTLQIVLVLSVGVFAVTTGIIRVILIETKTFAPDVTYEMPSLGIWTNLEGHVDLWCGCFPALQPILRKLPGKLPGKLCGATKGSGQPNKAMGSNVTQVTCERNVTYRNGVDNESQRGIVSAEMGVEDRPMRNQNTSTV
ncbi:hypothetical protein F5B19DRAFT_502163 [Rostrohypoxylon terebratum]|nr:hypothetical protein F5B19DRAFT_502163 [Rostrohypoxylon terebratum]